jgi:hypothetical protein
VLTARYGLGIDTQGDFPPSVPQSHIGGSAVWLHSFSTQALDAGEWTA